MLTALPLATLGKGAETLDGPTIYGVVSNDRVGDLTGQWISFSADAPAALTGYGRAPYDTGCAAYANGLV